MCVRYVSRPHGSQSERLHSPTPKPVHAGRLASPSHRGCPCSQSSRLWLLFLVYVPRGNCPVCTAAAYKLAQMNILYSQPTPHGSEDGCQQPSMRKRVLEKRVARRERNCRRVNQIGGAECGGGCFRVTDCEVQQHKQLAL